MSKFTKELVDLYANKLLFKLSEQENAAVLNEFDIIEENMELIANIEGISDIEPMTHALDDFSYVLREDDDATSGTPIEELLQNCDSYEDLQVSVPKVVG
jgi:aspartyl/glutamyl-tRNA(Asn/Gln) amidotransferase C subunit